MTRMASLFTALTTLAVAASLCATPTLAKARPSHGDRVDARIKELHAKLHITPDQEELWKTVTAVMRDNAHRMDELTQARAAQAQTITAIDDLKSYTAIAEAHAEGLKKFLPAFEALYASMPDAQKQQADTLVRQRIRAREKRR